MTNTKAAESAGIGHNNPPEIIGYETVRADIETVKKENEGITFDYESPDGYKAARSHVAKLRPIKTSIEKTRKDLKDESLRTGQKIDKVAKELTAEVEALIAVHMVQIQAIDDREAARVSAIKARLDGMTALNGMSGIPSAMAQRNIDRLKAAKLDDETYAEFLDQAIGLHASALAFQEREFDIAKKREDEQAELERLRKLEVDKIQKDREDQIRADAKAEAKAEVAVEIQTAVAEVKKTYVPPTMAQALRFYADGGNDGGKVARTALGMKEAA